MSKPTLSAQAGGSCAVSGGGPPGLAREPATAALKVETHRTGERITVVATGEIDMDTCPALRHTLGEALAESVRGVDLDLAGVDFCDCSGLNVLLLVRRRASADGKTVAVRSASRAVERLLTLSDTSSLFRPASDDDRGSPRGNEDPHHGTKHSTTEERSLSGDAPEAVELVDTTDTTDTTDTADAEQSLRVEILQLRRAMQTRPVIDLARGVLMASFGLDPDDAWSVLVAVSQNANIKLFHLAESTVAAVTGEPLPEALRQQLSAAVAEVTASRAATQRSEP
ncbi:anti-sigma factor antagonist [Streptomyces sp. DSM 40484]|uniref:anti-sigma factor antagonist n=1 Tax=Streptomyces kroppenstedtii TaxID=3051181 RepID=UPI0028D6F6E7|nr:anti-sigma factor antagonist [Streptomyces sp. DSM 40484]